MRLKNLVGLIIKRALNSTLKIFTINLNFTYFYTKRIPYFKRVLKKINASIFKIQIIKKSILRISEDHP